MAACDCLAKFVSRNSSHGLFLIYHFSVSTMLWLLTLVAWSRWVVDTFSTSAQGGTGVCDRARHQEQKIPAHHVNFWQPTSAMVELADWIDLGQTPCPGFLARDDPSPKSLGGPGCDTRATPHIGSEDAGIIRQSSRPSSDVDRCRLPQRELFSLCIHLHCRPCTLCQ